MRRTRFTKFTSSLVALMHLVFSVLVATPGLVHAQTIDVDPPSIELELVEEGLQGETQVFSATVTDNDTISSMTLHYRFGADSEYLSMPMSNIAGTSIYTVSIETADRPAGEVIQYYMEARDAGSNRTVQGFAFDPFERVLVDDQNPMVTDSTPATTTPAPIAAPGMSTTRKILYGVVGLLVVGGLASAAGGGSTGNTSPNDTNVVIVVPPPPPAFK